MVAEFGEFSTSRNEANIRDNANAFLARITHEQAMRYESTFQKIAASSAVIAKQAAFLLENMTLYGKTPLKPNEKLVIYPHNGIFSNDRSKRTMVLYWGSPTMSPGISEQINTLSHLDPLLETVKESNPESVACYAVTEPGVARYYPNIHGVEKLPPTTKFDIRNANWYVIAKPENNLERKTVWSNIYLDSVGQGLLTTASTPVYSKSGQYLGATGVDVTLDTIVNDILTHIPSCHRMEGLFSFLIDNQGRIVAFPPEYLDMFEIKIDRGKLVDATVILKHSLLDSSNVEIRKIGQNMLEKNYHVSRFFLNGHPYIISSHFMPSTGWRLGIVVPESAILASIQETRNTLDATVEKMTNRFTLVTVLFLITSIIIIATLSIKNFIRPLDKLSKGALRVKEGDLTTQVDIHTKDEIGSLAKLFNNMVDTLREAKELEKEYTQTLEQKVKDRTQEIMIRSEDLKKIRERLELAMDAGEHGFWDWNLDTDDVYFSPRYYTMLGYEPGELPMKLETWVNLMHPDDQKTIVPEVENYVKNAQPYEVEFRLKTKDGDWKWISGRGKSYEKDVDGIPHRAVGVHVDITGRKQAEEALRESEEMFKKLFEFAPDGFYLNDLEGNFIDGNKVAQEIIGYKKEELVGSSFLKLGLLPPEEIPKAAELLIENFNGRATGPDEFILNRKGRTPVVVEIMTLPVTIKSQKVVLGIARDITLRKRTEKALKESEEKYRTILESIENGYYEVDIAGNFTFFNDSACRIFGYPRDKLMGMNNRESMSTRTSKRIYKAFNNVYKTEKPTKIFEYEIIREDGTKRYVETSVSLREDSEGQRIGFRGIIRDITEKKLAEEEKKNLEAKLQRAEKMEAIGTLAGGVAHDLNNVLSGIVSYPELLLLDLPENSPLRKPILTIQQSGQKAADIVQDLLTLARRGVVATEVVNLNQVINSYLKSPECEKLKEFHPDVKIESDIETNLLNIMGSPVHVSKSIMNLVSNAAEAMPDGGNIFISTESRYIDKPIRGYDDVKEGDYVILTVSDIGIGISSENIERMFEPFYTKKVMGRSGTGLGMAVVWGTVKDHKGYIDIQSVEGKGTTFTLFFPVTRKEISGKEKALPMEDYMGKGESILVVDDVEGQREIASSILIKLGYSVTSVSSGEEAVDYMKDNKADLLILDMIMDPGIDGLDTYKRIIEFHPGQKAIIASGFSETDRVKEAQRLGAGKYIKKPYTLEKIGMAVKNELS